LQTGARRTIWQHSACEYVLAALLRLSRFRLYGTNRKHLVLTAQKSLAAACAKQRAYACLCSLRVLLLLPDPELLRCQGLLTWGVRWQLGRRPRHPAAQLMWAFESRTAPCPFARLQGQEQHSQAHARRQLEAAR